MPDGFDSSEKQAVAHHLEQRITTDKFIPPAEQVEELANAAHVDLSWRSWVVVFLSCLAVMAQIFVTSSAGSVIAFIVRDLGEPSVAGWIIQGPLLIQSVLAPLFGRLSDVIDRKYLSALPPLIATVGSIVCARADNMATLIGGGILIGVTTATIAIVQAIPSEVLPLKYRALANGLAFIGGAIGGLLGNLLAGAVTNANPGGWRSIFWIQAAFHATTFVGLMAFYWPRKSDYPRMKFRQYVWACDPIGSVLFVIATTLLLLGLTWGGGQYAWNAPRVIAGLVVGSISLIGFCVYEWKGRSDGLVAHAFFKGSPNFLLSIFAFAIEGWIFYSAVNTITSQLVLHLGFEDDAWRIAVRGMAFNVATLIASGPIILWATKRKDLKTPLMVTFFLFLLVCIFYATIRPNPGYDRAQIIFTAICGLGQAGPLTLIVALVQFSAPHAFLSTATGLAFSARAIGGAFGTAVLDAVVNSRLAAHYAADVSAAALAAGADEAALPPLFAALQSGTGFQSLNISQAALGAATLAGKKVYADGYRRAWASLIPFVVVAMAAILRVKGVKELMTEKIEASVEKTPEADVTLSEKI